uniref:Uncharacterized protein n=1 Tax=Rhizophora mucronata TaxID=61149 RepID=A0A2P2NPC2_RHIMU
MMTRESFEDTEEQFEYFDV